MSVQASIASIVLSGCPEVDALRLRPNLSRRTLDASQQQSLEGVIQRAEKASFMESHVEYVKGWTKIEHGYTANDRTWTNGSQKGIFARRNREKKFTWEFHTDKTHHEVNFTNFESYEGVKFGTGKGNEDRPLDFSNDQTRDDFYKHAFLGVCVSMSHKHNIDTGSDVVYFAFRENSSGKAHQDVHAYAIVVDINRPDSRATMRAVGWKLVGEGGERTIGFEAVP